METYLLVLDTIMSTMVLVYIFLTWAELFGRPRRFICQCPMFPYNRRGHLKSPLLLAVSVSSGAIAALEAALVVFQVEGRWDLIWVALYGLFSWAFYKKWKEHNKGNKKGSLAKLLARVKVTSAGLRIIPLLGKS